MTLIPQTPPRSVPQRKIQPSPNPVAAREALKRDARQQTQAVYLGERTMLCRVLGRFLFYVDSADRTLAPQLLMNGCWEPAATAAIQKLIQPGMVCLDVGAKVGYFTTLLADLTGPGGAVIAFEHDPRSMELMRGTLELNGHLEHTVLSDSAVTDRDGDSLDVIEVEHPLDGDQHPTDAPEPIRVVRTVSLDGVCQALPRVDFVRIDFAGMEEQVWDGMQAVVGNNPDIQIALDFHSQRRNAGRLLEKILSRFPVLRHIDCDGSIRQLTPEEALYGRGERGLTLILRR